MGELIEQHSGLSTQDAEWLHLLVGDWQVISDLAFADLVLGLPTNNGDFVAVAHAPPSTGATVHHDDVVGSAVPESPRDTVHQARERGGSSRTKKAPATGTSAIRGETQP